MNRLGHIRQVTLRVSSLMLQALILKVFCLHNTSCIYLTICRSVVKDVTRWTDITAKNFSYATTFSTVTLLWGLEYPGHDTRPIFENHRAGGEVGVLPIRDTIRKVPSKESKSQYLPPHLPPPNPFLLPLVMTRAVFMVKIE